MRPTQLSHALAKLARRLAPAALLLLAPAAASAQSPWSVINTCALDRGKTGGTKITSIVFLDERRGVLGGDAGLLRFTQNGGITWRVPPVRPPAFKDDVQRIVVSGSDLLLVAFKSILLSHDGGYSWKAIDLPYPSSYEGQFGIGSTTYFYDGYLVGQEVRVLGAAYDSRGAAFIGSFLLKLNLTDYTPTARVKRLSPVDPGTEFYRLFFVDNMNGWVVGSKGGILKTIDGGGSWNPPASGGFTPALPPGGPGMFPTTSVVPAPLSKPSLMGVFFIDQFRGWIVGEKGTTLFSTDGGESWEQGSFGVNNPNVKGANFTQVQFLDANNGWAVGSNGSIIKTTNGGQRWDDGFPPMGIKQSYFSLYMWKDSNGWVVGAGDTLLRHDAAAAPAASNVRTQTTGKP